MPHPTNLVIQIIATIVVPNITMVATNNSGETIANFTKSHEIFD